MDDDDNDDDDNDTSSTTSEDLLFSFQELKLPPKGIEELNNGTISSNYIRQGKRQ